MPVKVLALLTFLPLAAMAQCNCANLSGCASVCQPGSKCYNLPAAQYQLANFYADECASFQDIKARDAAHPQPKIMLTGQDIPCLGPFLSASLAAFGAPCANGTFSAQMLASGMTTHDTFVDIAAFFASTTCGSRGCMAVSDCARGGTLAFTSPATAAPAGSGPHCKMLSILDSMVNGYVAHGVNWRSGIPGVVTDMLNSCYPTLNLPYPLTEAQYEACVLPPTLAMFDRYGAAISSFQVLIEPLAAMQTQIPPSTLTVAYAAQVIKDFSTAIKAVVPSVKIGAAFTGPSYPVAANISPSNSDICFAWDWIGVVNASIIPVGTPAVAGNCPQTTQSATHTYLDFVGWDAFNGTSDQSNLAYSEELQSIEGTCTSAYCTGFIANTRAGASPNNTVTVPWGITQTDLPGWAPYNSTNLAPPSTERPSEPNRYLGCIDVVWLELQQLWNSAFVGWVSANGGQFVSRFFTTPLYYTTANQQADNCNSGTGTPTAMGSLAPNDTALSWTNLLNVGPGDIFQGGVTASGGLVVTQ